MRLIVTGIQGQVVTSLIERAAAQDIEIQAIGRPELDLSDPDSIARRLDAARADVVINAAAYTAVDKAESEEAAATRPGPAPLMRVATASSDSALSTAV